MIVTRVTFTRWLTHQWRAFISSYAYFPRSNHHIYAENSDIEVILQLSIIARSLSR